MISDVTLSDSELEKAWRKPPPGTEIIKTGKVKKGDWFYIEQLGAWGLVPKSGWGTSIILTTAIIARGEVDMKKIPVIES